MTEKIKLFFSPKLNIFFDFLIFLLNFFLRFNLNPDELFTAKLKNDSIFFENFGGRPSTFVKKNIVM